MDATLPMLVCTRFPQLRRNGVEKLYVDVGYPWILLKDLIAVGRHLAWLL